MRWSNAYNFNIDDEVTIDEAMRMRRKNDPRSGALHCCRECFASNSGYVLQTRDNSGNNRSDCFAKWPIESGDFTGGCASYSLATTRRESMDYAFYYREFERYFGDLDNNCEPYFIDKVSKPTEVEGPDFILEHSTEIPIDLAKTQIVILDENKRKKKRYTSTKLLDNRVGLIVIRISEYTPDQLLDFQRGGIDLLHVQWNYLVAKRVRQQELEAEHEVENREADKQRKARDGVTEKWRKRRDADRQRKAIELQEQKKENKARTEAKKKTDEEKEKKEIEQKQAIDELHEKIDTELDKLVENSSSYDLDKETDSLTFNNKFDVTPLENIRCSPGYVDGLIQKRWNRRFSPSAYAMAEFNAPLKGAPETITSGRRRDEAYNPFSGLMKSRLPDYVILIHAWQHGVWLSDYCTNWSLNIIWREKDWIGRLIEESLDLIIADIPADDYDTSRSKEIRKCRDVIQSS